MFDDYSKLSNFVSVKTVKFRFRLKDYVGKYGKNPQVECDIRVPRYQMHQHMIDRTVLLKTGELEI